MAGTPAGTVVVRVSGLRVHGGTVTAAGNAAPRAGEPAVFCRPVVTAPAVVRRDGTVLADGWLPDFVRLGELERHLGDGVIEAIVDAELAKGRLQRRERRRLMSYPLVIRLMLAMGLMPESYCEALARLAGLLADVSFALEWHVPTEKVVTGWRLLIPADVMEGIFWKAAGPLIGDGEPSAVLLAGMMVLAADGMLVNLADTPANRAMSGSTGTADDSAPFPQLRVAALTARAGRAMLGAILGRGSPGEQTLLKRLAKRRPDLFAGRVTCFDRNFPGYDLITAILEAGGHVIARMKEGISLDFADGEDRGWLPDGSRLSWLNAPSGKKQDRLPVRVTEHNAILPAGDGTETVSETCTVITTLPGHQAAPADQVRETCLTRRSASETTSGEDKATITGAGNRTSGPVLRSGSPRLVIQEARAWLTGAQLTRASAAAALRGEHAAARALRRRNQAPVTADEESFTAVWRHAIRSMTSTQVTASSSLPALAAAARAALHTLNLPGRQRRSKRAQKARPKFPHATATKTTATGKPQVTVFAPGFCLAPCRDRNRQEGGTRPGSAGAADRGTARHPRRDTRASPMPRITAKQTPRHRKNTTTATTQGA
ncbi:MAG: hypothetical protein ACRDNT_15260 [Streptosporangiaceae bacterium]